MNYKNYFKDNKCPYCGRTLTFNADYTDCWCPKEKCGFNHQFDGFKIVASIKVNDDYFGPDKI